MTLVTLGGLGLLGGGGVAYGVRRFSQRADPEFTPTVARPANLSTHPRVCIDGAHRNFATATGRYRPFAALLRLDGYRVESGTASFSPATLSACQVLVIANALGSRWPFLESAAQPAFAEEEEEAVVEWVGAGGSLLLVADHDPAGAAAARLARRFGVDMSQGRTYDDPHSDWSSGSPAWLVFGTDTGALILDHPITRGRDSTERVRRVVTFAGQSLRGPEGSVGFLALGATARDRLPSGDDVSAAGRAQALALSWGKGRVVVLGEAAMLSAQVIGGTRRFGMSWPGTDDQQLALNVVRWLSRSLEP